MNDIAEEALYLMKSRLDDIDGHIDWSDEFDIVRKALQSQTVPAVPEELKFARESLGLTGSPRRSKKADVFLNTLRQVPMEGDEPSGLAGPKQESCQCNLRGTHE